MPFNARSIAIKAAVMGFFIAAIIGWVSRLLPFTCCKRAVIAAVVAYITILYCVKTINAISINAMAAKQMNQQLETERESTD